jgi:2,4-dienoyl-CoA reductase-like NADH-dependent reductase (Old Yellow Enzyme family)
MLPHLGTTYDVEPWKKLAAAMHACPSEAERPISLMQLCHTGRQSPRFLGGRLPWIRPLAPSAKRVGENVGGSAFSQFLYWVLFQRPREMTEEDIDNAMDQFLLGVEIASRAGFDGIQLHGSHGCEDGYI